jgi:hypothetical protein
MRTSLGIVSTLVWLASAQSTASAKQAQADRGVHILSLVASFCGELTRERLEIPALLRVVHAKYNPGADRSTVLLKEGDSEIRVDIMFDENDRFLRVDLTPDKTIEFTVDELADKLGPYRPVEILDAVESFEVAFFRRAKGRPFECRIRAVGIDHGNGIGGSRVQRLEIDRAPAS